MFIKSIVLDGFKSYAQRTEITGFDPLFNAITGLNGSGKSNILDSICFVLGISNLHHVRATNLQELVYKNGQAGITKATVSIVFDNSDASQCPFGYSHYDEIVVTRQVIVGGRNKYMINGSNASNQKVADLFKSVALNINNPHFLIMQGRITKVLNMKPPEILSMIEEAAGTRLYESKRENAEKMMEKKESKLREIDTLINEETGPTLERLKKERDSYIEYQKVVREIDHLNKLHIAWQYVCLERDKTSSVDELVTIQDNIKALQDRCYEITNLVKSLDVQIEAIEAQIQGDQAGAIAELEEKLHEKQQQDAVASSNYEDSVKEIKSQTKLLKEIQKHLGDDTTILSKKHAELNANRLSNENAVKEREGAKAAYASAQKRFQSESAGLASNEDGEDATLNDQLLAAKNAMSKADTDTKNAQMKIKHSQEEVKKRKSELKKTSSDYEKDKASMDNLAQQIKQIEAELKELQYEEGSIEKLRERRSVVSKECEELQHRYNTIGDRFPQLQFDYIDPCKNFDRSKVRGPVAKLLRVKDVCTVQALEVVAGGKLYNIVVDDDKTAQLLLDKGQLKRKYTILPLNKLNVHAVDDRTVQRAKSLVGDDNANLALQLVDYDKHVEAAMKHVFGNAFICTNADSAKKVTYDRQIMKKSVTLEGDSFDPAGTLTGGSRPQSSGILSKLTDIQDMSSQLQRKKKELTDIDAELQKLKKVHEAFSRLDRQRQMKCRELEMLQNKLKQTTHGAQLEHIQNLEDTIEQEKQVIERSNEIKANSQKKVKELEHMIKNAKEIREERLKHLEQELKKTKKDVENLEKKYAQREQESETLKLEVETLEKEVESYKQQLEQIQQGITDLESKSTEFKALRDATKAAVKECMQSLKAHKDQLNAWSKEITTKVAEQKSLKQEHTDSTLKIEELAHNLETTKASGKNAGKQLDHLVQKHDWINEEKQYFGQANTAYDFSINDPKETSKQISRLQEKRQGLETNVNMRAMTMLDQAQSQHSDMLRKRRILVHDKEKMAMIIVELNEKKNIAVEKAYKQVNKDFSSIFSTLLPGATSKLAPPDGKTCLDGLEVRVGFGDVWKDSLTELSGGQRSLVALSLILAMLLFKPAPLYILDEVDAALDLSHTQNIGQMLKTHFRQSQFIVVSLKDGMFQNANVLFRTRFVDGVSTVMRYTQSQKKALTEKTADSSSSSAVQAKSAESEGNRRKKVRA